MKLLLTNDKDMSGQINIVDEKTGVDMAYTRLDLTVDHMKGPMLRAIVTLPINTLPIFNSEHPIKVDSDLVIEIAGAKYRVVPVDD